MMTEIEIEIIRLALDTEVTHKDYAKHNLAAKKILNANEAENKGQLLTIDSVVGSCSKCGKEHPYIKSKICDECLLEGVM